jgi:hypothetical protein
LGGLGVAELFIASCTIVIAVRIIGSEPNVVRIVIDRLDVPFEVGVDVAAIVESVGVIGFEADRLGILGNSFLVVAFSDSGVAAIERCAGLFIWNDRCWGS